MKIANGWLDYQIIDMANGEKIEKWGEYILRRPDPQIIWNSDTFNQRHYDAIYHRSDKGGGYWEHNSKM
jgi:23S rRNA (cytosine1962-C5)-methyltransferase